MSNYNSENLLQMVELYASEMGFICTEDELTEKFEYGILPSILEEFGKPGVEFTDTVMVNEVFSNWSDSLCKDGEIHPEQCNNYCYVGRFES